VLQRGNEKRQTFKNPHTVAQSRERSDMISRVTMIDVLRVRRAAPARWHGQFEGGTASPRQTVAAPDHVAVVVVRASQWSSWC
jgi:hypothetical protein